MSDQFERLQLGDLDPNATIWRYLTFPKFISLLLTQALWFSKLSMLEDTFEGMTPALTRAAMKRQHRDMEDWFPDENRKQQVRQFVELNEADGRELIVANCWFMDNHESQTMWDGYARNAEGVAISSTARRLANSLAISHKNWWIGKITYIDFTAYSEMNLYDGSQAHRRAFLKSTKYSDERELRVATMNWVAPGCLNPDGSPQTDKQKAGLVYSLDRPGILVLSHLPTLITQIRTAPKASEWHHNLIKLLIARTNIKCDVMRSTF